MFVGFVPPLIGPINMFHRADSDMCVS